MADVSDLMARVRAHGANLMLDGGRLKLINGKKLPAGALDYIKQNGKLIADWLDREAQFEERAAIIEFDGGAPREWAEQFAQYLFKTRPEGVNELDWTLFLDTCGRMLDEAPVRRAA